MKSLFGGDEKGEKDAMENHSKIWLCDIETFEKNAAVKKRGGKGEKRGKNMWLNIIATFCYDRWKMGEKGIEKSRQQKYSKVCFWREKGAIEYYL